MNDRLLTHARGGGAPLLLVPSRCFGGGGVARSPVVSGSPRTVLRFRESAIDLWLTDLEAPRCIGRSKGYVLGPGSNRGTLLRRAFGRCAQPGPEAPLSPCPGIGARALLCQLDRAGPEVYRPRAVARPLYVQLPNARSRLRRATRSLARTPLRRWPRRTRPEAVWAKSGPPQKRAGVSDTPGCRMAPKAGDRVRTGDIQLGRLTLYQLSYTRAEVA